MQLRHTPGFTALELMIAMTIAAITLAAGVPAFKSYQFNLRMKTAMDTLRTDLNLARSRAISLGVQTVVCPLQASVQRGTGPVCSDNRWWHRGWMVFTDLNGDRQRQPTEPVLRQSAAFQYLTISSSRARKKLRFSPNGSAAGSNATMLFCDQRGNASAGAIRLANTGRIRLLTRAGNRRADCP